MIDAPVHQVAEIVDGELFLSPRPAAQHAVASSRVGGLMSGPFDIGRGGPGGRWILDETELHSGEDVLVPDIAGWRRDRMPTVPAVAYFELAPDWVCEVVSPKTGRLDRMRKLPVYARERVAHAWLIDPLQRTVEVFRRPIANQALAGTCPSKPGIRPRTRTPVPPVAISAAMWQMRDSRCWSRGHMYANRDRTKRQR